MDKWSKIEDIARNATVGAGNLKFNPGVEDVVSAQKLFGREFNNPERLHFFKSWAAAVQGAGEEGLEVE